MSDSELVEKLLDLVCVRPPHMRRALLDALARRCGFRVVGGEIFEKLQDLSTRVVADA